MSRSESRLPIGVAAGVCLVALALAGLVVVPLAWVFVEVARGGPAAIARTFADPATRSAIGLTILAAAGAVTANALFGLIAGWTIAKYRFPGKALLVTIIDAPLTVSPVVAGLAVLASLGERTPLGAWLALHGVRITFAPAGIVLATMVVTFPYVARAVIAQMTVHGRALEEAAVGLGASTWQTFARVTFPLVRASFLNGLLICNARAIGEFGAVSVVSGAVRGLTETVPLRIADLYDDASAGAAFTLAAALALVAIVLALAARAIARHTTIEKGTT